MSISFSARQLAGGLGLSALLSACIPLGGLAGFGPDLDLSESFAGRAEIERLHFFHETRAIQALRASGLSGSGVRVTLMGEMIDPTHPDLAGRIGRQYNAFASPGRILPGNGALPWRGELLGPGDGHGTHIAGTIAANCDGAGIRGLACGARVDAYDLGAYDNSEAYLTGPAPEAGFTAFIDAFALAIDDVRRRGQSHIVSGSFNIEAPAIRFPAGAPPLSEAEILAQSQGLFLARRKLLNSGLFDGVSAADMAMLERAIERNDGDLAIGAMALLPRLPAMQRLADAIAAYQRAGGVYLVTESNYRFDQRSSVLNALPDLFSQVDRDLWLSVVMIAPRQADLERIELPEQLLDSARYSAPLNGCGRMAHDYCIVVPSWEVISTITERVREPGMPGLTIDNRLYQSFSGHSMGAPMVAAALALMQEFNRSHHLGLSMKQLVTLIKQTANRSFLGYDPISHGQGLLDISAALEALKQRAG